MKVAIIGRTGAGRSTVFDALTGLQGGAQAPGKTRLGIARVLDARVEKLTELCQPKKTVFVEVTLALPPNATSGPVDIKTVREMRDLWAYAHVVAAFAEADLVESARAQMNEMTTELVLADMERVENRKARIAKGGGARPGEDEALARATDQLEAEKPLRTMEWDENARTLLGELGIMSHRPLLTVINVAEEQAGETPPETLQTLAQELGSQLVWLSASLESEISALDAEAQAEFLGAYDLTEPASRRFIQAAFSLLDQICFFTVGPDEVRAWNIPRYTKARRAARAIHTDLEKGFIRAEVVDYNTFVELGSEAKCKSAGKLRLEGKDYEVQDGDIITVRFNV